MEKRDKPKSLLLLLIESDAHKETPAPASLKTSTVWWVYSFLP